MVKSNDWLASYKTGAKLKCSDGEYNLADHI